MIPARLISGAQDGADLGGLRAGMSLSIPTGGACPFRCRTTSGERSERIRHYGLQELATRDYGPRTILNVRTADVTILFGLVASFGSQKTWGTAIAYRKGLLINPSVLELRARDFSGQTINIAGNREETNRGIEEYVYRLLIRVWGPDLLQATLPLPEIRVTAEDAIPAALAAYLREERGA